MNFEFSDEQRMLSDSLTRFLADKYDFEKRRKYMDLPGGFDPAIWRGFADLGIFALPFGEDLGGLDGTSVETMIVGTAMGNALANEPWAEAMAIAPSLLQAGSEDQRAAVAEGIIGGETIPTWAHLEPGMVDRGEAIKTSATADGVLNGAKSVVAFGGEATLIFVTATGPDGLGLYMVKGGASGMEARAYKTQDGRRAAELIFDGTPSEKLVGGIAADQAIALAEARAVSAVMAESLGCMEQAIEQTVEYIKGREQFGRAIGSFQALQHIAAGAVVEKEQVKSMAMYASVMCDDADASARDLALSAAKVKMCDASREVGQMSIQLHGGVGMTMEYAIGHYFKRMTMLETAYGDRDFHMDRLCEAGGLAA